MEADPPHIEEVMDENESMGESDSLTLSISLMHCSI